MRRGGKSGQRRAMHRLTAGCPIVKVGQQIVPQKITACSPLHPARRERGARGEGENVR